MAYTAVYVIRPGYSNLLKMSRANTMLLWPSCVKRMFAQQFKRAAMLSALLLLFFLISDCRCQPNTSLTTLPTTSQYVNTSSHENPSQLLPVAQNFLHSLAEDFQSLPFAEDWPSSSAAFERPLSKIDLLALKVDHSLMSSLDKWLAKYGIKMPQSVLKTIDEMDLCPERASDGMIRKLLLTSSRNKLCGQSRSVCCWWVCFQSIRSFLKIV